MKNISIQLAISLLLSFTFWAALGQSEKQAIRQGNREYKKGEFLESEISYRSALEQNPSSFKGNFNLSGSLYKQENYEDAAKLLEDLSASNASDKEKAKVYHNLGNTMFQQQKFQESVEAYKNALRFNPDDKETKYNLAQAQRMLIQQQQQQQQQNNQGNNDQNNKEDQNKDQDKQQDQQNKENQQDKNQDQKKDQQKQQENEQQISPEDARRMLEALQNNERDVQDRVREQQAKAAKVRVEKNW